MWISHWVIPHCHQVVLHTCVALAVKKRGCEWSKADVGYFQVSWLKILGQGTVLRKGASLQLYTLLKVVLPLSYYTILVRLCTIIRLRQGHASQGWISTPSHSKFMNFGIQPTYLCLCGLGSDCSKRNTWLNQDCLQDHSIWSVTALPLVAWLPYRRGLSAHQRHQSAIYHLHWSMEWTTGYTIALFPALLCMELCAHGGEDWLFLDILCLQHAPHITMTTKYPLLAKSCDPEGIWNLCTIQTVCV